MAFTVTFHDCATDQNKPEIYKQEAFGKLEEANSYIPKVELLKAGRNKRKGKEVFFKLTLLEPLFMLCQKKHLESIFLSLLIC